MIYVNIHGQNAYIEFSITLTRNSLDDLLYDINDEEIFSIIIRFFLLLYYHNVLINFYEKFLSDISDDLC